MLALPRHQGVAWHADLVQRGLDAGRPGTTCFFTMATTQQFLAMLRANAGCPGCWGHTGGQDPSGRVCILPQWGECALRDASQSCLPRQDSGGVVLGQCGEPAGSLDVNMHGQLGHAAATRAGLHEGRSVGQPGVRPMSAVCNSSAVVPELDANSHVDGRLQGAPVAVWGACRGAARLGGGCLGSLQPVHFAATQGRQGVGAHEQTAGGTS